MIPVPEKRIADFEKLGFGMFIHYGLYSLLGKGEWIQCNGHIPEEEYRKLADKFTAADFDAKKIAKTAKAAGMKYITLTTRHHEGFSLYDTCGLSDYDAPHAPNCRRDLIREFVDACNEEGLLPMFYHTTLDWHVKEFNDDFKTYLKYLRDSVEVLCTNYGRIGGLWFDGNWSKPEADWEVDELYATIRRHQPEAMIINNTGLGALGEIGHPEIDSVTFEQGRPSPMDREGMAKYVAAEMCVTINDHWGVGYGDYNYKSLPELIETLCACRKVGANCLINVGPTGDGAILPIQQCMLEEMGNWIRTCGTPIYTSKPCEIKGDGKNFALTDGVKDYFFIHDLGIFGQAHVTVSGNGEGIKHFSGVKKKVKSIRYTDNGQELEFIQKFDELFIYAPACDYGTNYVVRVAEADYE